MQLLRRFGIMSEEVTLHDTLPWTILLSQRSSYTVHPKHQKGNRGSLAAPRESRMTTGPVR